MQRNFSLFVSNADPTPAEAIRRLSGSKSREDSFRDWNREGRRSDAPDDSEEILGQTIRGIALKLFGSLPKPSSVELADLVQAGNVGLLQARRSYNPGLGVPLCAYARYRIRGEMLDAVHRSSPLGNHIRSETQSSVVRTIQVDTWIEKVSFLRPDWVPERRLLRSQNRQLLTEALTRLPTRERTVLQLKYAEDLTLRQIGAMMRVKESRACQIHRSALAHLRRVLERSGVCEGAAA